MELEAYLEGESRPFIVSHSQECAACADLLADLQSIRSAASRLAAGTAFPGRVGQCARETRSGGSFRKSACVQFGEELEAYLEGETRPFVPSHAQDCGSCGALLADLQLIRQAAGSCLWRNRPPRFGPACAQSWSWRGLSRSPACAQFQDGIEDYLEGEARPFVVSHSQDCRSCGTLLADLEAITWAGSDLPIEEPRRTNGRGSGRR